jgi:predicted transcriptional regulator
MSVRTVVRRVRLTPEEDDRLARIAKSRGADLSKVIREAIDLLEKEDRRRAAYDELIAMAQEDQKRLGGKRPPKERFALK